MKFKEITPTRKGLFSPSYSSKQPVDIYKKAQPVNVLPNQEFFNSIDESKLYEGSIIKTGKHPNRRLSECGFCIYIGHDKQKKPLSFSIFTRQWLFVFMHTTCY